MKLCSFTARRQSLEKVYFGCLLADGKRVLAFELVNINQDEGATDLYFLDALRFFETGPKAVEHAHRLLAAAEQGKYPQAVVPVEDIQLLSPLPQPRSIRDCLVFEQHFLQAMQSVVKDRFPLIALFDRLIRKVLPKGLIRLPAVWYQQPIYYKGNAQSVIGHDAQVRWPLETKFLDYELEIGVVIGRQGRDIPVEKAAEYIAGYTIFNDFTARDIQMQEMQGKLGPAKGKDFDTGNAIGPYLVTPDEVPDPYDLTMLARVNGEEWSRGTSADMYFKFPEIIAHISRSETLYPGEFIGSGTIGNGCGLELGRKLKSGDVVELEVDGLGILRNVIQ